MMRSFLPALLLVITVCGTSSAPAATQGPLDGRWLTQDTRAIVEVAPCGTEECGKIVWVKDPINPQTGKPRVDRHNPDLALQHRPIIGLATLSKIVPNASGNWSAVSYDPRDGETHDITIRLSASGGKIELKGCLLGGLLCDSEIWTKAQPQPTDQGPQQQTSN